MTETEQKIEIDREIPDYLKGHEEKIRELLKDAAENIDFFQGDRRNILFVENIADSEKNRIIAELIKGREKLLAWGEDEDIALNDVWEEQIKIFAENKEFFSEFGQKVEIKSLDELGFLAKRETGALQAMRELSNAIVGVGPLEKRIDAFLMRPDVKNLQNVWLHEEKNVYAEISSEMRTILNGPKGRFNGIKIVQESLENLSALMHYNQVTIELDIATRVEFQELMQDLGEKTQADITINASIEPLPETSSRGVGRA